MDMEAKRIEQRRRIAEVAPDMVRTRQEAERVITEQARPPLTARAGKRLIARQLRGLLARTRDA